jgi:hexosaminidase
MKTPLPLACALAFAACRPPAATVPEAASRARADVAAPLAVLPLPQKIALAGAALTIPRTLACALSDSTLRPLLAVLDGEYRMLAAGRVIEAVAGRSASCRLSVDPMLGEEEYRLSADSTVSLSGGSYRAVAMGSVTLLQMLERRAGGSATMPRGVIADQPSSAFRALLVDVGRQWHEVSVLEQLIELARWYKITYVQLHLTDHDLFSFPTRAYPELPTAGKHYAEADLRHLDEFARARGVTLVPEFEVPGHAARMIDRRPDLFGFSGVREWRGTINMGREAAYAAIDTIIGEIAAVFRTTPFIHIGGDEASLDELTADADVQRYMAAHDLADIHELYRHFLVRVNEIVKRHGKQTIVWEGFRKEGRVEIPRDMLVMAWETVYQLPQDLLAGGYTLVNVSWKPLYVVNHKKWPVEYIYERWNLYRWENWVPKMPSFSPIQLDSTAQVIGAMMCAWEQPQHVELPSLRRRLPALGERLWNGGVRPRRPYAWFERALDRTDSLLQVVLSPVKFEARGLRFPGLEEGHYGEEYWFDDTLTVILASAEPSHVIRYTLDGGMPTAQSERYARPIRLGATTHVRARAFTPSGEPVGYDRWIEYQLRPLHVEVLGDLRTPLSSIWEPYGEAAQFARLVTIRLSSGRGGTIRYTVDDSPPTPASPDYRAPIELTSSATVRARLFAPTGEPTGHEWAQRFERIE